MTPAKVIEAYVKTRSQISELEKQIAELKAYQAKKEEWLLNKLAEDNAESIKTEHGTVYTTLFESVTVADKDTFLDYVKSNDLYNLMEIRASKAECLHTMGDKENGSRPNPLPPGLNYTAIKKVGIRKG